jgi:hypothetical protein
VSEVGWISRYTMEMEQMMERLLAEIRTTPEEK